MSDSGFRSSQLRSPAEEPRASTTSATARLHVLAFSEPVLSSSAVLRIESALREAHDLLPVAIDCQQLTTVTAAGLSALLELGRSSTGMRELALTQLSRALTLVAVESGLSERFSIYATTEACLRSFERIEASSCAP
jgi:anti-anti-sigma regulatory factor